MVEENRAFNEMLKAIKKKLKNKLPEEIEKNSQIDFDEKSCEFSFVGLSKAIKISYPDYEVVGDIDNWYKLVILHYMEKAIDIPKGDGIITFAQLTDGLIRGSGFDRKCESQIQNLLGKQSLDTLEKITALLGGRLVKSNADFCAEFDLLPKYSITVKIWLEDEELAASGRFFLSSNADYFLSVEDAVTAGEILLEGMEEGLG